MYFLCHNSVFQLCGSRDWNFLSVSSPFGLTIIFDSTDIHLPYKINCDDFGDPFTFHIVPPADQCLLAH